MFMLTAKKTEIIRLWKRHISILMSFENDLSAMCYLENPQNTFRRAQNLIVICTALQLKCAKKLLKIILYLRIGCVSCDLEFSKHLKLILELIAFQCSVFNDNSLPFKYFQSSVNLVHPLDKTAHLVLRSSGEQSHTHLLNLL